MARALSWTGKLTIVILTFASFVLTLVVYLAPEYYNQNNVSLITVFPSTVAIEPGTAQEPTAGPTVILGVFGMKICYSFKLCIDLDHHHLVLIRIMLKIIQHFDFSMLLVCLSS